MKSTFKSVLVLSILFLGMTGMPAPASADWNIFSLKWVSDKPAAESKGQNDMVLLSETGAMIPQAGKPGSRTPVESELSARIDARAAALTEDMKKQGAVPGFQKKLQIDFPDLRGKIAGIDKMNFSERFRLYTEALSTGNLSVLEESRIIDPSRTHLTLLDIEVLFPKDAAKAAAKFKPMSSADRERAVEILTGMLPPNRNGAKFLKEDAERYLDRLQYDNEGTRMDRYLTLALQDHSLSPRGYVDYARTAPESIAKVLEIENIISGQTAEQAVAQSNATLMSTNQALLGNGTNSASAVLTNRIKLKPVDSQSCPIGCEKNMSVWSADTAGIGKD